MILIIHSRFVRVVVNDRFRVIAVIQFASNRLLREVLIKSGFT